MPIDWVALVGVLGAVLFLLIPILGLTARFALKPVVESMIALKGAQAAPQEITALKERIAFLENQLSGMETELSRLQEARDFENRLLDKPDPDATS
jgi:hypothetical protein